MIKILFIYSRDIELNDSGGARTLIQLINHLSQKDDVECFCLFRIEGIELPKVNFISRGDDLKNQIHDCILQYGIHILMTPEAVLLGKLTSQAVKGTKCKTVTALHNMPGYEKIGLSSLIIESLLFNETIIKRVRAFIILMVFPIFKLFYEMGQKRAFRDAYLNNDIVVLLSERFYDSFIEEYGIPDSGEKLRAVGNGLSFDRFAVVDDIINKKKQLLVVSRFDERQKRISKAIMLWSKLFAKFPDWKLVLVGFGRSESYYRYLVKKYNVKNIEFVGKQKPLPYYMESSIFLMTSDFEGWGMTITEAQQCGCVPVALDTYASLTDLITDGFDGFIAKSMDEMENKISILINDSDTRLNLAKNGVETSKRFIPESIYNDYYHIFKELVD